MIAGLAFRCLPLAPPALAPRAIPPAQRDDPPPLSVQMASGAFDSAAVDPIVAADIFARSRVAPPPPSAHGPVVHVQQRHAPPSPRESTFTLQGTTIGPGGAVALIATAASPQAHVYSVGDSIEGARLILITDSTAVLTRVSGVLVLHLPPSVRSTP
jgi:hypothetical protein